MMNKQEVVQNLNALIEVCKDGEHGYKAAAEGIDDKSMKTVFRDVSEQRAELANELTKAVLRMGGEPEKSGTLTGSLQNNWIKFKSLITGGDKTAILNECESAEDRSLNLYKEMLLKPFPEDVSELINKQFDIVKSLHDSIKALRDRARAASA